MTPIQVIQRLASVNTDKAREQILIEAWSSECYEFFALAQRAYDPFYTFGVTKVAEIVHDDHLDGNFSFESFEALCHELHARRLTGEAARNAINEAAYVCDATIWNALYRRVLLKDLQVVDANTVAKVCRRLGLEAVRYRIPSFKAQIPVWENSRKNFPRLSGLQLVEPKLSGTRALAVINPECPAKFFDQKGREIQIQTSAEQLDPCRALAQEFVLDGVLTPAEKFIIFDVIPYKDFRSNACPIALSQRRKVLEGLQTSGVFATSSAQIGVLPAIEVDFDQPDVAARFAPVDPRLYDIGHRTVVIKDPASGYDGKRSASWVLRNVQRTADE